MTLSTREKIIEAAIQLVNEKGYKGTTTKRIAEVAGVNEVTLFRHFGSKKGIVKAAIEKYDSIQLVEETLKRQIVWELERDLKMLVKTYQHLLERKRAVILLSLKEANEFPELNNLVEHIPEKYVHLLEQYFQTMINMGKIKEVNPRIVATNFVFINFGYFLLKDRLKINNQHMSTDEYVDQNIGFFIQTLQ